MIEKAADNLYRKASSVAGGSIVVGLLLGCAFGAVPLTSLGANWPISRAFGIATLLLGGLVGGLIGYVVGDARAFGYKLEAQAALCQAQIERNTATTARYVAALGAEIEELTATLGASSTGGAEPQATAAPQTPVEPPLPPMPRTPATPKRVA